VWQKKRIAKIWPQAASALMALISQGPVSFVAMMNASLFVSVAVFRSPVTTFSPGKSSSAFL